MRFAVFSWIDVGFFNPFLSLHSGIDTYRTIVIIKSNLAFEITKICRVLCRYSIPFLALPLQAFNQ